MSNSDCAAMEPIPVLAQCCGMVQCLFYFSLFLIKKSSFSPQMGKNKESDNNLKQGAENLISNEVRKTKWITASESQ